MGKMVFLSSLAVGFLFFRRPGRETRIESAHFFQGRLSTEGVDLLLECLILVAARQGRVIKRVGTPPRKAGQPPSSESLVVGW